MGKIPTHPEEIFEEFSSDLRRVFEERLISVILFGSGARGEYVPTESDLNFLVVLNDNSPSELAKFYHLNAKWRTRNVSTPLFLTEDDINTSLDVFPIEFFEMKSAHKVVWGKDVLWEMRLSRKHLRLQCEREIKGKILHLKRAFLEHRGSTKNLGGLIRKSLTAFAPVFRAVLYLTGVEPVQRTEELLAAANKRFGLDLTLFARLHEIGRGKRKADNKELDQLFDRYVQEITRIGQVIDQLIITEKEEEQ